MLQVQRESVERAGESGFLWMSPQSAKMVARKGRWSDGSRERRGIMKMGGGSFFRCEYCCLEVERETGQKTRQ